MLNIPSLPTGSKSVVGSSMQIILGWDARTEPIASLCFCPPDNVEGCLFSKPSSLTVLSILSILLCISFLST